MVALSFIVVLELDHFFLDLYIVVGRTFIDHLDVKIFVAKNLIFDGAGIAQRRLLADVLVNFWILREHCAH